MASFADRFFQATFEAEREDQARRKQVVEAVIAQFDAAVEAGTRGELVATVEDIHPNDKATFAPWQWWYKRLGFKVETHMNEERYDPQIVIKSQVDMQRRLRVSVLRKPMNLPV